MGFNDQGLATFRKWKEELKNRCLNMDGMAELWPCTQLSFHSRRRLETFGQSPWKQAVRLSLGRLEWPAMTLPSFQTCDDYATRFRLQGIWILIVATNYATSHDTTRMPESSKLAAA